MATHKEKFLKQAVDWIGVKESGGGNKYAKGSELEKIFKLAGISKGTSWCAAFIVACGKRAGIVGDGKLMGVNSYAPGICHTVITHGGTWIKGPYTTKTSVKPQPGDLILFNNSSCHMTYKSDGSVKAWHGNHVGIVYSVSSTQVTTIEGNSGNKVALNHYKLSNKTIGGYARPKWAKVDKSTSSSSSKTTTGVSSTGGTYAGPLYKTENDRHDMTMREIGYMDANGKLTTASTDVSIAIINYTTLLGDLYDMFPPTTYGSSVVNTNQVKGNAQIVLNALLSHGFNAAAACGIAGNIQTDSGCNPAATSKDNTQVGLCMWKGTEATKMKTFVGQTSWATNLSDQVAYLVFDLENNYSKLLSSISAVSISVDGAKKAAKLFAQNYRKITSSTSITTRQTVAQSYFGTLVVTSPVQAGQEKDANAAKDSCTVIDTSKKKQLALSSCWTYYDVGTCDTTIRNEWIKKGQATNNGLAYMDGCYLVSVNVNMGVKVEDYIILDLNGGGTMKCIVAGGNNDTNTFLRIYRPRSSNINLRDWATTTIKQIRDFGKRSS